MKALAVIMTILVFLSGFDLCEEETRADVTDETVFSLAQGTDNGHQDTSDTCNSFCHCGHHPFSVLLPRCLEPIASPQPLKQAHTLTDTGYPVRISGAVWQPPRMV